MMTLSQTVTEPRSNEEFCSLLDVATKEVFRMMVGTELNAAKESSWHGPEFTAMIGLAGDLCGVLSVRCGQNSATRIAALMLDLPAEKAVEHAWDALGEIANMVAGNFKNKLNGKCDKCMLSVPTVITGADYKFRSLTVSNSIVLWFAFESMPISVVLESQREQ